MNLKIVVLAIILSGILILEIKGQNWDQVTVIDSTDVYSVNVYNQKLYAVASNKVYVRSLDDSNWEQLVGTPNITSSFTTIYAYKDVLYLGSLDDGIFRSTNNGVMWEMFNNGLPSSARGIVKFVGKGDSLFVGTDFSGIYVNDLKGVTWQAYNSGLFVFGTSSLASVGNNLLAGIGMFSFKRATDENEWQSMFLDSNQSQRQIYDFLNLGNYIFAGTDNGVYRGNVNADNWVRKDISAFPGRDIAKLTDYDNRLIAGIVLQNEHWIFTSEDYGESWNIQAHEFAWMYDLTTFDNNIWAARSDGLWYYDISGWTDVKNPEEGLVTGFELYQNYPNPFNPSTKIQYSVHKSAKTQVKIFDVLGNEIATIVDEYKQPGNYEIEFNAINLPSGVYFYTLMNNDFRQVRKMTLLK